ncbi:hypothetical protein LACDD01_02076 [Lactococcus sp. DD01]|nr:hypothetical protein LACDD01_02076 [Lactococcus sp. DD01]
MTSHNNLKIKATTVPAFKAGRALKDASNKKLILLTNPYVLK